MNTATRKLDVVIIDDEPKARRLLVLLVENNFPHCNIVGVCQTVEEAKLVIKSTNPNIVFLDINLTFNTGFDLLDSFPKRNFEVIFITNFVDHAIRAIDYDALAYITKPVTLEDLSVALDKAHEVIEEKLRIKRLEASFEKLTNSLPIQEKEVIQIKVPILRDNSLISLNVEDIIRCEANGDFTTLYLKNPGYGKMVINKGLGECEEMLVQHHFFRVHRSHLLNLVHIKDLSKLSNLKVKLNNGDELPIARRRKLEFKQTFNDFHNENNNENNNN